MSSLSDLTSFLWWLMLLSSTAIILYDIATAAHGPIETRGAIRKPAVGETEDEVDVLAKRIARALRRPSGLQVIETSAAEAIMTAAFAAKGLHMPKGDQVKSGEVESLLRDPEVVRFVEEHLINRSSRPELKRGQMLSEFEKMVTILDKAGMELS